jgi:small ligand-binding sensory domain FIST
MPIRIGAGLSRMHDAPVGAIEAAPAALVGLAGGRADVAVAFACGTHLAAPEAVLEGVHEALRPRQPVGCGASGVAATLASSLGGAAAAGFFAAGEIGPVAGESFQHMFSASVAVFAG